MASAGKKILALIPARGGSKGVFRKNLRLVDGKPLIAHTIEAAKRSRYIDRLVLSSEDAEIMAVAAAHGCDIPFTRPMTLANDEASTMDVIFHTLDQVPGYDLLICLQPTSPLRSTQDIDHCIEMLLQKGAPSCVSICETTQSPYWMYKLTPEQHLEILLPEGAALGRRQELPITYTVNGAVYVADIAWLKREKTFLGKGAVGYVMPEERSLDLDEEADFEKLQWLLQSQKSKSKTTLKIDKSFVGTDAPIFIIAEAGVNHNGSLELAKRLVDAAIVAKADAVKFQTFVAESVVTSTAPQAQYQTKNTNYSETQLEMIKKFELPFAAFAELKEYCDQKGILFLSTPFDTQSADFLASIAMPAFKVPSGELTNWPFLEHLARKKLPMLVSTGMATMQEVAQARELLEAINPGNFLFLHCVSNYPAKPEETNLRAIESMKGALGLPVGFSDHSNGIEISCAAAALGACVIEKHFTIDKNFPGPDHLASLEPHELSEMVRSVRNIERSLGNGIKKPNPSELAIAAVARRSLIAAKPISKGSVITADLLTAKRPGTGISPTQYKTVLGRRAKCDIAGDTLLDFNMLEAEDGKR